MTNTLIITALAVLLLGVGQILERKGMFAASLGCTYAAMFFGIVLVVKGVT